MKLTFLNRTLLAGSLLAAGLTATAAPLQRGDLPADPAWILHVDVDALRPTSIGQFLQTELEKPENQARLSVFQSISSLDLRTQLHGLTLYGTGTNAQDGVLIVYADFDPAKLVTLAQALKEPENSTYKAHTIYSWLDEKKARHGQHPRIYAAIQGSRVLFGQREASVGQALDVLDGALPKLSSSNVFPQFGAVGDTSFIEAGGQKVNVPAGNPNAALFRLSKVGVLQLNEAQGQVNATLTLEANDSTVAEQIFNIGQGLLGLMKLQQDKPEAAKLANALTIKQDGPQVVATLSLPSGDVIQLLKTITAREAAKKAQKQAAESEAK